MSLDTDRELEYRAKIHKTRLREIKKGSLKNIDNSSPFSFSANSFNILRPNFNKSEHFKQLMKENLLLITKLEKISERKVIFNQSSYPRMKSFSPKSLNYHLRLDSLKKIAEENYKIFEKIRSQESLFSQRQMNLEFKMHQKLKKNIGRGKSKVSPIPRSMASPVNMN